MSEEGYQGGTTRGGRWGCADAAFLGFPLFFFLLIGDALGDCVPDTECHKDFPPYVALPTAIFALVVGFGIRAVVNRWRQNGS